MASQTIGVGQVLSGAIVSELTVTSGGRAVNDLITGGLSISSGGSATGTVLSGVNALSGGTGATVDVVYGGGSASGTVVNSLDIYFVQGFDTDAVVSSGGEYVLQTGSSLRPDFRAGSKPGIFKAVLTSATIESGAHLYVNSAVAIIVTPILQAGGSIDYGFLSYSSGASVSFDNTTNTLSVVDGGTVQSLQLLGNYSNKAFIVGPDAFASTTTFSIGTLVTAINVLSGTSTISATSSAAAQVASYARYDATIAASLSGAGTNVVSAALDRSGDVAIYSTPDGTGHALSASGTGTSIIAAGGSADTATVANGSDLVATGLGTNNVYLVTGNNTLDSEGTDTVFVGAGADTVNIAGNTVVNAGAAALSIFLSPNASLALHTGAGSVTVQGGFGSGAFSGGTNGHNLLVAGTGPTTLYAGGDGDTLIASGGSSTTLYGWGGHETMVGQFSQGVDTFNFGGASVFATGGSGQNIFNVGTGANAVVALLGTDTFNLTNGGAGGSTYIANFNTAVDHVHLTAYAPDETANALATATTYAGSEILMLRDGTSLTFGGVTGLTKATFV